MARYLLDSGPLAAYLFGRSAAVALIDPRLDARAVATSPLVYAEVGEYLLGRPDGPARRRQLRERHCQVNRAAEGKWRRRA